MNQAPSKLPVSKLYAEYCRKKKAKKLKQTCCCKYLKKKGKYCGSCPTLHAILKNAGGNI